MELEIAEGPGDSVTKNEPEGLGVHHREKEGHCTPGLGSCQAWRDAKQSCATGRGVSGGSGHREASWKGRWGLAVSELLLREAQMSGSGCLLVRHGQGSSWTL